jgi:hypothetical protein
MPAERVFDFTRQGKHVTDLFAQLLFRGLLHRG